MSKAILGLSLLILICLSACVEPVAKPHKGNTAKSDHQYMVDQLTSGIPRRHNLADDREHRFLLEQMKVAGLTPDRYPGIFASVANTRKAHLGGAYRDLEDFSPQAEGTTITPRQGSALNSPLDLGLDTLGNYTGSAVSYVKGGTISTILSITMHRADTGAQIGKAANLNKMGTTQYLELNAQPAVDPGVDVYMLYTYLYQTADNIDSTGVLLGDSGSIILSSGDVKATITNTDPKKQNAPGDPDQIVVCMWRHANNKADCDYWNNTNGIDGNDLTIMFPVNGSVSFTDQGGQPLPIVPIDANCGTSAGFPQTSMTVFPTGTDATDMCYLTGPTTTQMWCGADAFGTINNNTATWAIPHGSFKSDGTQGRCLVSGQTANYTMLNIFSVNVGGVPTEIPVSIRSTSPSSPVPLGQHFNLPIKQLKVEYGCLAEGTQITMADGKNLPIESVQVNTHSVASQQNTTLQVVGNSRGVEPIPMIEISTADGHRLMATSGHPIVTSKGIRLAKQLAVGDIVITSQGRSALVTVAEVEYRGRIWNLDLGQDGSNIPIVEQTMFANGILVGDQTMQEVYEQRFNATETARKTRIPEGFMTDYQSYLEDQAGD